MGEIGQSSVSKKENFLYSIWILGKNGWNGPILFIQFESWVKMGEMGQSSLFNLNTG